jgi:Leucine-rich repeat (LRR) protein
MSLAFDACPQVVCLPNLMILNASYNQISDMFEHVELPNLRMLNLAFNALEDLPDKMGHIPHLELLYISNNKLEVRLFLVIPGRQSQRPQLDPFAPVH